MDEGILPISDIKEIHQIVVEQSQNYMKGGIEQDRNSKGNLRYLGYDEVVQTDREIEIV